MMRVRITFSKGNGFKYTSHLDLARVWERSLRRAKVPLAYSSGFNPRPRMQLAAALPLGHTAGREFLDAWLEKPVSVEDLAKALVPVLPDGLAVSQVRQVELKAPPLQTQVTSAEYHVAVEWNESAQQVGVRIAQVLQATELIQKRKSKQYDLRPLIERLRIVPAIGSELVLEMQLAARQGATARPEAVLEALGMGEAFARHHRRQLITELQSEDS